jgi:hypothetical protein
LPKLSLNLFEWNRRQRSLKSTSRIATIGIEVSRFNAGQIFKAATKGGLFQSG